MGIFIVVAVAVAIDELLGVTVLRLGAIGYYIATECISLIENWGDMGLPIPKVLKDILSQIRNKADEGSVE